MTNQEAIEFLKNIIDRESIGFVAPSGEGDVAIWQYHVEALQMAIKALELATNLQPCNQDCISREAAIDAHYEYCNKHPDAGFPVWSLKILKDLPSAQTEWDEMLVICDNCGHAIHVKRLQGENDGN